MEIAHKQYNNCDLVKPDGRVDSATSPELGQAMEDITKAGRYKIVLDLSQVDYMSSAGLRVLINTQKECKHLNRGELVLALVPERVYEALELAGFERLFKIFDDVTDAVGNF